MKKCGIYLIKPFFIQKVYLGSSKNLSARGNKHKTLFFQGNNSRRVQEAFDSTVGVHWIPLIEDSVDKYLEYHRLEKVLITYFLNYSDILLNTVNPRYSTMVLKDENEKETFEYLVERVCDFVY